MIIKVSEAAKNPDEALMQFCGLEADGEKFLADQAALGIGTATYIINKYCKNIKDPDVKEAIKAIKNDITTMKKQLKMLETSEQLNTDEYSRKLCYSVIQMLISAWHIGCINGDMDEEGSDKVYGYLANTTNVYEIAKDLKAINQQKMAWGAGRK